MEQTSEAIIDVQHLEKRFKENDAVRGLSFNIRPGEFFGLLGPNGAGKSTTIGMLTGLIKPTTGNIFIKGRPFPEHSREIRSSVGFVPQDFAFYPSISARDNLNFFGRIYGLYGDRLKRRRKEVLSVAALSDRERDPVAQFSNGMKRRLNLAIALLHKPDILILDEPTVGVDAHSRHTLLTRLTELNRQGMTVLYTTHHMEEAQRLCHRVAIMDHGVIAALDAPGTLIQRFGRGGLHMEFNQAVNPSFLEQLASWGEVSSMDEQTNKILLRTQRTESALKNVISLAEQEKVPLKTINVMEDNLESVFLNLTGRYLRDQRQDG